MEEGLEQYHYPDNAHHIDAHVGKGCAAGLHIGLEGRDIGCDGGADILTQHQHDALLYVEHAGEAESHGDGHDGC